MSPIPTATREKSGRVRPYPRPDVFVAPPKEGLREMVVDWQLPPEMENRRPPRNT